MTSAGKKRSDAIGEVADTYKIDESTVVRFLKEYRHCQEEEELSRPDDWDKPDDRK